MEALPIDMNNPAVRDYLALVRLQVLTPLSLLINIATVIVCATVVNPTIGGISRLHPTAISPKPAVIAIYVLVIFLGQIGYCLLLVLANKPETKRALIKGVGLSLVFANWIMALWAVSWVMQWFLFATILQGILILMLVYSNLALLVYHPPVSDRPLDTALIHAPLRFFFILPVYILFPLCLFITLGLTYHPTLPGPPVNYSSWHAWTGFGVVFGTNFVGLLVVLFRRDIVWCVAATWICVSIWSSRPKPGPVYITVILFTVLHPLALLISYIYARFYSPRGRIALPADANHPGLYTTNHANTPHENTEGQGPREIDTEAGW
ncbi:hypothetical protein BDQ12DRAFT_694530 [Crucibulum laeve]|uniref:Uncharacterized protein n=1 Tax=Crucibulum laeve TaxID=68775 RepID=A0A5C3LE56_9AGAR|nr:hypothetical protein BDQ12DRAFT_694530 [Crucibulum laeve]